MSEPNEEAAIAIYEWMKAAELEQGHTPAQGEMWENIYPDIRDNIRGMARAAPTQTPPDRKALARLVEPATWKQFDNLKTPWDFARYPDGPRFVQRSLAKADQILALFNAPPQKADGWLPTHRHVKRETEYEYLGRGRAQCSESGLLDDEHVAIYRGEDGSLWARRLAEFNDGRFEAIPAPPQKDVM